MNHQIKQSQNLIDIPKLKNNVKPYSYQKDAFYECIKRNTILILPTGLGKTLISILTFLELFKNQQLQLEQQLQQKEQSLSSQKVALFLVNKVPLVKQQADSILQYTDKRVLTMSSDNKNKELIKSQVQMKSKFYDILVATSDTILNSFKEGILSPSDFYFITFDEVHNATGNDSYCQIMKHIEYLDPPSRPKLLGLTASLINSTPSSSYLKDQITTIEEIKKLEKRMLSKIYRPSNSGSDNDSDNDGEVPFNNTLFLSSDYQPDIHIYSKSKQEEQLHQSIIKRIELLIGELTKKLNYKDIELTENIEQPKFLHSLKMFKNWLLGRQEEEDQKQYIEQVDSIFSLYNSLSILLVCGPKQCVSTILIADPPPSLIWDSSIIKLNQDPSIENQSNKFKCLLNLLKLQVQEKQRNGNNNGLNCIIFVQTRITGKRLKSLLKQDQEIKSLKPKLIVGHDGEDGMKYEKQKQVLQDFKSGFCQILVSTNVLEEGIDLKECSLVICYDNLYSLVSLIQRRGRDRSGNHGNGSGSNSFKIIIDKSHIEIIEKIIKSEVILNRAIIELLDKRSVSNLLVLPDSNLTNSATSISSSPFSNTSGIDSSISGCGFEDNLVTTTTSTNNGIITIENQAVKYDYVNEFISIFHIKDSEFNQFKEYTFKYNTICLKESLVNDDEEEEEEEPYNSDEESIDEEISNIIVEQGPLVIVSIEKDIKLSQEPYLSNFISIHIKCDRGDRDELIHQFQIYLGKQYGYWILNSKNIQAVELDAEQEINNTFTMKKPGTLFEYGNMIQNSPIQFQKVDYFKCCVVSITVRKNELLFRFDQNSTNSFNTLIMSLVTNIETYCLYSPPTVLAKSSSASSKYTFYFLSVRPSTYIETKSKKKEFKDITSFKDKLFGKCTVYRIEISLGQVDMNRFISLLKHIGIDLYLFNNSPNGNGNGIGNLHLNFDLIREKNDDIYYLLHCLDSNRSFGKLLSQSFINEINKLLLDDRIDEARYIIGVAISKKTKFYDYSELFKLIWKTDKKSTLYKDEEIKDHDGWVVVREVYVTPSRIVLQPPKLTLGNRMIRMIRDHPSCKFILFNYTDEMFEPFKGLNKNSPLTRTIADCFKNGIEAIPLSGQLYQYLGNSQSQIKSYSAWFIIEDKFNLSIKDALGWCGIERITEMRKQFRYACLLYTTTRVAEIIDPDHVYNVPDIIGEYGHNFTEGCGWIGRGLLDKINKAHGYTSSTCAYQIRYGGSKGVLVVNDDPKFDPFGVYLRRSMTKFTPTNDVDQHRTLEIVSISTTSKCKLNRQAINLLSCAGVEDSVFLRLLESALNENASTLVDLESSKRLLFDFFPKITEYELFNDNYIRRILLKLYKSSLFKIQEKCSIEINESRNLLGCIDTTGTLGEDQVYIEIDDDEDDGIDNGNGNSTTGRIVKSKIITGRIAVLKNPSHHPGDIRFLTAVNHVPLNGKRNVLFFSTLGDEPNFKQCSGSDLDGDRYLVIYDQTLITDRLRSYRPYLGEDEIQIAPTSNQKTNLSDIYINNSDRSCLGKLSNKHLAICDIEYVSSDNAVKLAIQCAIEVDSVKTNRHGTVPNDVNTLIKEVGYPHYMNKGDLTKSYYHSTKVIGTIYDNVDNLLVWGDFLPDIKLDQSLLVTGYQSYVNDENKKCYLLYKSKINSLLRRYGAEYEEDLLIGFMDPKYSEKWTTDLKTIIKSKFKSIQNQFFELFLNQFNNQRNGNNNNKVNNNNNNPKLTIEEILNNNYSEVEKKISAWYYICYSDIEEDRTLGFYRIVQSLRKSVDESQIGSGSGGGNSKKPLSNSILSFTNETKDGLYSSYNSRIQLFKEIKNCCKTTLDSNNCKLILNGSTSNLLLNLSSNLNLYLKFKNGNGIGSGNGNEIQLILNSLQSDLFDGLLKIKDLEINQLDCLIEFKYKGIQVIINLDHNSFYQNYIIKEYLLKYPFLYAPCLIVAEYGFKSYLLFNSNGDDDQKSPLEITQEKNEKLEKEEKEKQQKDISKQESKRLKNKKISTIRISKLVLITLFIRYSIENGLITEFSDKELDSLFNNSNNNGSGNEEEIENTSKFDNFFKDSNIISTGDILLGFFKSYSEKFLYYIYNVNSFKLKLLSSGLNQLESTTSTSTFTIDNKLQLSHLGEQFRFAYHGICTLVNIHQFLNSCCSTTKKLIQVTKSKIDKVKSVQLQLKKKVELLNVAIHFNQTSKSNLTIEINGLPQQLTKACDIIRNIINN